MPSRGSGSNTGRKNCSGKRFMLSSAAGAAERTTFLSVGKKPVPLIKDSLFCVAATL